jgi:hypothetical protein
VLLRNLFRSSIRHGDVMHPESLDHHGLRPMHRIGASCNSVCAFVLGCASLVPDPTAWRRRCHSITSRLPRRQARRAAVIDVWNSGALNKTPVSSGCVIGCTAMTLSRSGNRPYSIRPYLAGWAGEHRRGGLAADSQTGECHEASPATGTCVAHYLLRPGTCGGPDDKLAGPTPRWSSTGWASSVATLGGRDQHLRRGTKPLFGDMGHQLERTV